MRKNKFVIIGTMGLALGYSSCVDNNYDLDNIDMTLGVNTVLTLPTCSTGDILLKNIMDLKEDGIVQSVPIPMKPGEFMYVVKQAGEADIAPVKIDRIELSAPQVEPFNSIVNLSDIKGVRAMVRRTPAKVSEITLPEDRAYTYVIDDTQGKQVIEPTTARNISEDVVTLKDVKFENSTVTLTLQITGFPAHINRMHLDGLKLRLPQDLQVSACTLNGVKAESVESGVIRLTKDVDDVVRLVSDDIVLKLTLVGATANEDFTFDATKHEATLKGMFKIDGTFRIETAEMDKDAVTQMVMDHIVAHPGTDPEWSEVEGVIPTSITFTGSTLFDNNIHLTHISGDFKHEVGHISPVALNDLPDFLNDPEVVLDLDNPMVFLNVQNSLPTPIQTTLTLRSETDGNTPRSTGVLQIAGNSTSQYYLAEKVEQNFLPEENRQAAYEHIAGMSQLIKRIPKEVQVEVSTVRLSATDLDITKEYPIFVNYDVYAPLVFGPEFYLVYSSTENDWDLSDDIGNLDAECLEVNARISSNLMADIRVSLELIDLEGRKITTVEDNAIVCPKNAQNEPINLKIKAKEGHTLREILSGKDKNGKACPKLDGLRYRATLNNPEDGEALNENNTLKISDMKVSLTGVVTYDAN